MTSTTLNLHRPLKALGTTCAAAALVLLAGCGTTTTPGSAPSATAAAADGCIANFDAATDYFPVKQTLETAKNFTLSYHQSYQVLTVKEPVQGGKPETYVLVKCGAPAPELVGDIAAAKVVTTPVKSIFSASTTHIPSLEALRTLDLLTGVSSKAFISSKAAQQRVADSSVTEFAATGTADAEKIVSAKPDVLITGGFEDPGYATVRDAGVAVLADAEFLETDPLGRAEWIKYFAALTGTEEIANQTFTKISGDYRAAVDVAGQAEPQEVVVSQLIDLCGIV